MANLLSTTITGNLTVDTNVLYVDSTNNRVGIGTTSPSANLEVIGTIKQKTGASYTNYVQQSVAEAQLTFSTYSNNQSSFPSAIKFSPNNVEAVRIDNSGNVGIGTTSPATSLDVNGTISSGGSPIAWFSGNYNRIYRPNGTVGIYLGNSSDEGNYYDNTTHYFRSAAGVTNRMIINSSGNVLIGTTTDSGYKLDVAGNARANNVILGTDQTYGGNYRSVSFGNNADGANRIFATSDTGDGMYFAAATGRGFRFRPNGGSSDLLTIDSSGNVGIGTTAPSGKLDVRGGKTYLSPLGNSGSGIDSHALVLRNLNDTAFTANALTAYNAHTSWDIENYSTFTASPRVNDASIYTYAGENASASVAVTRFVQFNSANTSPLLDWTFFQWDGAGTSALDLKKPSKLWTVKTYENGGVVEKMSLSGDGDMYIAGNVGIGTTNPDSKLNIISGAKGIHIDKGSYSSTAANLSECRTIYAFAYDTLRNGSTTGFFITNVSTNVPAMQAVDSSNNAQNISIQPFGGNVGIGTTAPGAQLHVNSSSTSATSIYVGNTSTGASRIYFDAQNGDFAGNDYGYIGQANSGYMEYNVGTSSPAPYHVFTNGNVGIGTTNPSEKLVVNGPVVWQGALVASQTNSGVLDRSGNDLRIRAYGATSGTGNLVFRTGGGGGAVDSEAMRITSSGNVGIGTTSPSTRLHVYDSSPLDHITIDGNNGDNRNLRFATENSTRWNLYATGTSETGSNVGSDLTIARYTDAGAYNGNVLTILRNSGNVGIGTTSPAQRLEVSGTILLQNNNELRWKDTGATERTIVRVNSSNELEYGWSGAGPVKFMGGGSYTERMRIHTNGNVGIGTTSPDQKLHIAGGDSVGIRVSGGTNNRYVEVTATSLDFYTTSVSGYGMANLVRKNSDGSVLGQISGAFGDPNTLTYTYYGGTAYNNAAMYILSSNKNVGIGTSSPIAKLDVVGTGTQLDTSGYYYNTRIKDTTNSGVLFGGNNTANGVGFIAGINQLAFLTYNSGWAERMRITSGGNVLIGTTTDNGKKLQVNGDVFIKGSTSSSAYADSIFEIQNSNGTSIMDFRGDAYAFFGCGQGGGAASGFIFRYNDTSHVQFTGYNYGNGAGSYKPILLDTDLVGRGQGIYVNFGGTGYANPAPTSSTEFAVRGRTSDATENVMELRDSNNAEKFVVKNDGSIVTDGSQGWTGTVAIPINPPGSQNLEFKNGILINVF